MLCRTESRCFTHTTQGSTLYALHLISKLSKHAVDYMQTIHTISLNIAALVFSSLIVLEIQYSKFTTITPASRTPAVPGRLEMHRSEPMDPEPASLAARTASHGLVLWRSFV